MFTSSAFTICATFIAMHYSFTLANQNSKFSLFQQFATFCETPGCDKTWPPVDVRHPHYICVFWLCTKLDRPLSLFVYRHIPFPSLIFFAALLPRKRVSIRPKRFQFRNKVDRLRKTDSKTVYGVFFFSFFSSDRLIIMTITKQWWWSDDDNLLRLRDWVRFPIASQ